MSLLLSFYADDFTGATDSLDVLAARGIETMLFLEPPGRDWLRLHYPQLQCVGVAGTSRAMSPERMESELRPILDRVRQLDARIMHYKLCSTADSSPQIGSVGKVLDMVRPWHPGQRSLPLLVAAPHLGRYTLFGQHFALSDGRVHRLDRHPVMSSHPVTPMAEADLRLHFSKQTKQSIGNLFITEINKAVSGLKLLAQSSNADVLVLDALEEEQLRVIGRWLWADSETASRFVAGSSGVQHALALSWPSSGGLSDNAPPAEPGPSGPVLVLSGSCSDVTRKQLQHAEANGFASMPLSGAELLEDERAAERAAAAIAQQLRAGISVAAYTALGPGDPSIAETRAALSRMGLGDSDSGERLGSQLGIIAKLALRLSGINRIVFAGGDTSGYAAKELGVYAMKLHWPAAPGAPLCSCYAKDGGRLPLELALKGGQLGGEDYLVSVKNGGWGNE